MCTLQQANHLLLTHSHSQLSLPLSEEVFRYLSHKVPHSYGVLVACQKIAALDPKLSAVKEKTREEFEVAALLHDIGRFYQHDTKKVFSSSVYPHGEKGYDILKNEGIHNPRILLSVKHHEKYDLSELESELDYMMADTDEKMKISRICHLIRDADKLQNLEYIIYNPFSLSTYHITNNSTRENKSVQEEILEKLRKKQCLPRGIAETQAEKLLYFFSWIFDVHYEGTKIALKQAKFRERYSDMLGKIGVRKEVVDVVRG